MTLPFACSEKPMRTTVKAAPPSYGVSLTGTLGYRTVVDHPDALGISGSCQEGEYTWLIAERNKKLLRLDTTGKVKIYELAGIPDDLDLEGLACKDGRFYMSTESQVQHRTGDLVLLVDLEEETSSGKVTEVLTMHYPPGMEAGTNQGLEGLCIAGDWLIAAGEILRTSTSGTRQAPVLRQKLGTEDTFMHWVNLTTATGKLSGIDCRMRGEIVEVFAVERHFEVSRLLQFDLGDEASKAKRVVELAHLLREGENYESLLVSDDGMARLSNDNQYKTITGATEETILLPIRGFRRSTPE
jgi:hypothetical protein